MVSRLVFCLAFLPAAAFAHLAAAQEDDVLQIIISRNQQSLALYRDGQQVATSKVSTGKAGHTTPTGIFSILEKRKNHRSNIYSNAPMPFMQRLTWSGIALHEGHVPAYPASHGCIRLPREFARSLYGMTERGVHVIVSDVPVKPVAINDDALFKPRQPVADTLFLTDTPLRPAKPLAGDQPVEVAMNDAAALPTSATAAATPARNEAPLRILITRRSDRDRILEIQSLLNDLGFDAGAADGIAGPGTVRAINDFRLSKNLPADKRVLEDGFITALYAAAGRSAIPNGQLFVRQNFKPLFSAPITILEPQRELGTHFLTVTEADAAKQTAEWTAVTLSNHLSDAAMKRYGITERSGPGNTALAAFDRIEINKDLRERIELLLDKGSSITITDNGISSETGQGTDFITLTQPEAPLKKKG